MKPSALETSSALNYEAVPPSKEVLHLRMPLTGGRMAQALPESLDFYQMGVATRSHASTLSGNLRGVLFKLEDSNGCAASVAFLFSDDEDHSMYEELGNLIASQLASRLQSEEGVTLLTSAPIALA